MGFGGQGKEKKSVFFFWWSGGKKKCFFWGGFAGQYLLFLGRGDEESSLGPRDREPLLEVDGALVALKQPTRLTCVRISFVALGGGAS